MKIAIIGGGAAGMTTAFLLNKTHEVTVFEKEDILGGNIRTLNKNIKNSNLNSGLVLDCGVLEFQKDHFKKFHKLMIELNVTLRPCQISSQIFLANGKIYKSGAGILHSSKNIFQTLSELINVLPIAKGYLQFLLKAKMVDPKKLYNKSVTDYFMNESEVYAVWLKMLLMYAYSTSYKKIESFPAEIAIPLLGQSDLFTKWVMIPGGVYTYFEKILSKIDAKIHCGVGIKSVTRNLRGVFVHLISGENIFFDKVIFAVTPEAVLPLLADASDDESCRFGPWEKNQIETVIHTDTSFYQKRGFSYFSEFDLFQHQGMNDCGYNAYLNRLYEVNPKTHGHFSLAFNQNPYLDSSKIIHRQIHHSPLYSVRSVQNLQQIISTNGSNNTFFAGAYLAGGLHEGAISSANSVSSLLNGRVL